MLKFYITMWHMCLCRVALINYGEEYGKLVVITDVVDQNRVCSFQSM